MELQARHSDEYQQEDKVSQICLASGYKDMHFFNSYAFQLSLTPPIESVLHTFEHSTPCKIEEIQPEDSLCAELKASVSRS